MLDVLVEVLVVVVEVVVEVVLTLSKALWSGLSPLAEKVLYVGVEAEGVVVLLMLQTRSLLTILLGEETMERRWS